MTSQSKIKLPAETLDEVDNLLMELVDYRAESGSDHIEVMELAHELRDSDGVSREVLGTTISMLYELRGFKYEDGVHGVENDNIAPVTAKLKKY